MAAPVSRTMAWIGLGAWIFILLVQAFRLYTVWQRPGKPDTLDWLLPLLVALVAPLLIYRYARILRDPNRNTGPGAGV